MHGQVDRSLFLCSYVARFKIIRELSYKMFNGIIVQKYFLLQKNISYDKKIYFVSTDLCERSGRRRRVPASPSVIRPLISITLPPVTSLLLLSRMPDDGDGSKYI